MLLAGQFGSRRENLLALLATGLFAAGLFFAAPTLLESADYLEVWNPIIQLLADTVREGHLPFWNSYIELGRPFLGDMCALVFYPPVPVGWPGRPAPRLFRPWSPPRQNDRFPRMPPPRCGVRLSH